MLPAEAGQQDDDELFFRGNPGARDLLRPAMPGEWPAGNDLYTSPPYTLVIQVKPGLLMKLGAWRRKANMRNTMLQLNKGQLSVISFLEEQHRSV